MTNNFKMLKCPYCGSVDKIINHGKSYHCGYCDCEFFNLSEANNALLETAQSYLARYKFVDADEIYRDLALKGKENHDEELYATALWGRVLAYFGIVYIKSFKGNISVPTIANYDKRYDSVMKHSSFLELLGSDISLEIKEKYLEIAKHIDVTYQKVSEELAKTPDYDVFICVKISTATKDHPELEGYTKDSKIADLLFDELSKSGLKVFYSEKCCQGIEYDSQILSALSRSKMLLVIGTKKEYLESSWVESEWRRWLNFISFKEKSEDSLVLYLPNYQDNFELPRILEKQKCQYFENSVAVLNHLKKSLMVNDEANQADLLKNLLKQFDDKNKVNDEEEKLAKALDLYDKDCYREAIPILDELAKKDNLRAIHTLGDIYSDGDKEATYNIKLALKYYEIGLSHNDPRAMNSLGILYLNGEGVEENEEKGFLLIKKAADLDLPDAISTLGDAYQYGYGVEKNLDVAIKYYQEAASKGSGEACCSLANIYGYNDKYEDKDKANKYFEEGAKLGDMECLLDRGYAYLYGYGTVLANPQKGLEYYEKAAEKNSAEACLELADYYSIKGKPDLEESWYQRAVDLDYAPAYYKFGCYYYFKKEYVKAQDLLEVAYKRYENADDYDGFETFKYTNKYLALAYIYDKDASSYNLKRAVKMLKDMSSYLDISKNLYYYIGYCYENGLGVPFDLKEARNNYELGANYGDELAIKALKALKHNPKLKELIKNKDAEAFYLEGIDFLETGKFKKAYKCFEEAAIDKHSDALYELGKAYFEGSYYKVDYDKAFKYFKQASDLGSIKAKTKVGICYIEGKGVKQDVSSGKSYLFKTSTLGDLEAQNYAGNYEIIHTEDENYYTGYDNLENAAAKDDPKSNYDLGMINLKDSPYSKHDYDEAFEYFTKAANLGYEPSYYELAKCYQEGIGVKPNHSLAIEWYKKALKAGNKEAKKRLNELKRR